MGNRRQTWPYQGAGSSPPALTLGRDAILNSARPLAGPLRTGTEPNVGPRGDPREGATDFGMDRIDPRSFDKIGKNYPHAPPPTSRLVVPPGSRRR